MARGLSDLQKWMLTRALENAESDLCKTRHFPGLFTPTGIMPPSSSVPAHLTRSEIRADFYKLIPGEMDWGTWTPVEGKDRNWLREKARFSKAEHSNYEAINVLSRGHISG